MFGYLTVTKYFEDTITRFDKIHEHERQTNRHTDRHRMTA